MNYGKMDKRIKLQKPNLVSDGAGGGKPATGKDKFIDVTTVWAEFKDPKFEIKEVAGAVSSVATQLVKIRYYPDVVKGWRFLYGAAIFPIDHTHHKNRSETFLICKEVVK